MKSNKLAILLLSSLLLSLVQTKPGNFSVLTLDDDASLSENTLSSINTYGFYNFTYSIIDSNEKVDEIKIENKNIRPNTTFISANFDLEDLEIDRNGKELEKGDDLVFDLHISDTIATNNRFTKNGNWIYDNSTTIHANKHVCGIYGGGISYSNNVYGDKTFFDVNSFGNIGFALFSDEPGIKIKTIEGSSIKYVSIDDYNRVIKENYPDYAPEDGDEVDSIKFKNIIVSNQINIMGGHLTGVTTDNKVYIWKINQVLVNSSYIVTLAFITRLEYTLSTQMSDFENLQEVAFYNNMLILGFKGKGITIYDAYNKDWTLYNSNSNGTSNGTVSYGNNSTTNTTNTTDSSNSSTNTTNTTDSSNSTSFNSTNRLLRELETYNSDSHPDARERQRYRFRRNLANSTNTTNSTGNNYHSNDGFYYSDYNTYTFIDSQYSIPKNTADSLVGSKINLVFKYKFVFNFNDFIINRQSMYFLEEGMGMYIMDLTYFSYKLYLSHPSLQELEYLEYSLYDTQKYFVGISALNNPPSRNEIFFEIIANDEYYPKYNRIFVSTIKRVYDNFVTNFRSFSVFYDKINRELFFLIRGSPNLINTPTYVLPIKTIGKFELSTQYNPIHIMYDAGDLDPTYFISDSNDFLAITDVKILPFDLYCDFDSDGQYNTIISYTSICNSENSTGNRDNYCLYETETIFLINTKSEGLVIFLIVLIIIVFIVVILLILYNLGYIFKKKKDGTTHQPHRVANQPNDPQYNNQNAYHGNSEIDAGDIEINIQHQEFKDEKE